MITTLVTLVFVQLVGITGLKFWTRRSQRKAELQRWAPFRQHPIIDPMLRKCVGEPSTERTTRWAAEHFKRTTRNFVNSEAFNIAVDGLANTKSSIWNLKSKLPSFGRNTTTKLGGDLQPADPSVCTIL